MSRLRDPLLQITVLGTLTIMPALVCAAQQQSPCEAYGHSIAIFVGKVIGSEPVSIKLSSMEGGGVFPARIIHYSVEERFKGDAKGTEEAVAGLSLQGQPDFKAGEQYLVYTFRRVRPYDPDLSAQRALPLSEASADLFYLRSFQKGEAVASITGKVAQNSFDVINWKLTTVTPPANVQVFLENSAGLRRESHTDESNTYHFNNIRPGIYRVVINTPPRLYTPVPDSGVDLTKTPCSRVDFWLQTDGRIAGRVLDAGNKPAIYLSLTLIPPEVMPVDDTLAKDPDLRALTAQADDQGRYEFRGVPPGRYLLGVNLGPNPPDIAWNLFPRTFYPGTPDRSKAAVIELSEAGEKLNLDFQLAPRLTSREIKGSVVLSNGQPAPCAMTGLIAAQFAKNYFGGTQIRVDQDGHFTRSAVDGYRYAVQAYVPVINKDGRNVGYIYAPSVEVVASENTNPLRLVMPPEANCDYFLIHPH